jgi:outer membrane protein TolC
MKRRLVLGLVLSAACGCADTAAEVCQHVCDNIILPEQRAIDYSDVTRLPPVSVPPVPPPRTVSDPHPEMPVWEMSLDDAIRIALENARVVRVLAGITATHSGRTIYDAPIINTTVDQEKARFDPVLKENAIWSRTNTPTAVPDPFDLSRSRITSQPVDTYSNDLGLTKTNVLGGQWGLDWTATPERFPGNPALPLNPQTPSAVTLSYTQPLLQGAGFQVNTAPIVIARLNTEESFFQYKDSVEELVRGVIEAYWNLVLARLNVWAREIQVQQSKEAFDLESARLKSGLKGDLGTVSQTRVTYNQFRASLIAAQADVLTREGALRNLLYLPPADGRRIVPVSAPASQGLRPEWGTMTRLAEQLRPDIIELKLVDQADRVRLIQAQNQALPRLDAVTFYRWNGLSGEMPNGENLSTRPGEFTDWSVGVNFSVPLGLRQGRALVREQRLLIARNEENIRQQVHLTVHQLAESLRELDSAFEQYQAYKETRAAADINLRVQNAKFRLGPGQTIYLNVLQALNDWGTAVSSEAQQLITYNITLANLERQTGTILQTHGLVFFEERFRAAGPLCLPSHDQLYPSAVVPAGSPHRYPGTGEPGENAFDLKNPAEREQLPEGELPLPRPVLPGEPQMPRTP